MVYNQDAFRILPLTAEGRETKKQDLETMFATFCKFRNRFCGSMPLPN